MNKTQSAITASCFVLGSAFLQQGKPVKSPPAQNASSASGGQTSGALSPANEATGDGPWRASCQYWAEVRFAEARPPKTQGTAKLTLNTTNTDANLDFSYAPDDSTAGCGSVVSTSSSNATQIASEVRRRWGLPDSGSKITAIIAVLPSPVKGHMELDFDRSIDAIVSAAGDNGWVPSYFWLPWDASTGPVGIAGTTTGLSEKKEETSRQPGLLILKTDDSAGKNFGDVIYLFLVAETPVLGIDGYQMQAALQEERELGLQAPDNPDCTLRQAVRYSIRNERSLAIIGPKSSGSAASLAAAVTSQVLPLCVNQIDITGWTSTEAAAYRLISRTKEVKVNYLSFGENTAFEIQRFVHTLGAAHYDIRRTAFLAEEGTVFGANSFRSLDPDPTSVGRNSSKSLNSGPIFLGYPREISLLRNAQKDDGGEAKNASLPSPYLPFSLKDSSKDDSIGHFSTEQTPLSQEARLLAIARDLKNRRAQFIVLMASNFLDEAFLSEFFRRNCPDARIVLLGGGDMVQEDASSHPSFVGDVALTPYNLFAPARDSSNQSLRALPDSRSESVYNAASYTFWDQSAQGRPPGPELLGYDNLFGGPRPLGASLWAIVVGNDGYYPLGLMNQCSSDFELILPSFESGEPRPCVEREEWLRCVDPVPLQNETVDPSLLWFALCIVAIALCVTHGVSMQLARYWSPTTHDLDIPENDHPRRRCVYINIGTAMLFSLTFVLSHSLFGTSGFSGQLTTEAKFVAWVTFLAGLFALLCTLAVTRHYILRPSCILSNVKTQSKYDIYFFFDCLAFAALVAVPGMWIAICTSGNSGPYPSFAGLFFSYRSLHPDSGVSPIVPVVLLLFGWYLWAFYSTLRLRFSKKGRPMIPRAANIPDTPPSRLFVSDESLSRCEKNDECFYKNITCLLITPQMIGRSLVNRGIGRDWKAGKGVLAISYFLLFFLCTLTVPFKSLDRFAWHVGYLPTLYEFLISALFFPLIAIALTGWLRMLVIWRGLRRGLLERLELTPLRFAFTRVKGVSWMMMLRQAGMEEYWRDLSRSVESLRQMTHMKLLADDELLKAYENVSTDITSLRATIDVSRQNKPDPPINPCDRKGDDDLPAPEPQEPMLLMWSIEQDFAAASEILLSRVLVPYWNAKQTGWVESEGVQAGASNVPKQPGKTNPMQEAPAHILLAEEFLAIRYLSLIRAVLVNMGYLMRFVSTSFILGIVALNSYPFQPRREIDWMFTGLLFILGSGVVFVFAQMHRNSILNRITDSDASKLGGEFWVRLATFGAVPVLTWLAYQFPAVGGSILRMVQPGLGLSK